MNSDAIAISSPERALKLSSGFSGQGGRLPITSNAMFGLASTSR
jgi:hypothetical protein